MEGFALLLGHLVGDFLLQTDWMAANKTKSKPVGLRPGTVIAMEGGGYCTPGDAIAQHVWDTHQRAWWRGHVACTLHCLLYTLACLATSWWFLPAWAYPVIFVAHWPVDRFRLASLWMIHVSGQRIFATALAPWSVIVVDNTFHLLVLFFVAFVAGVR